MVFWTGSQRGEHDPTASPHAPSPIVVAILGTAVLTALFGLVGWLVGSVVVGVLLAAWRRAQRRGRR